MNIIKQIKKRPLLHITLILVGGFFASYFAFDLLGGNEGMNEYFNWQAVISMLIVITALVAAWGVGIRNHKKEGS